MLIFSCGLNMRTTRQHDVGAKLTNLFELIGRSDKLDYTILHGGGDFPTFKIPPITETLFEIDESIDELLNCVVCLHRESALQRPS